MAARSLQPTGTAVLLTHPMPSSGNGHQQGLALEPLLYGSSTDMRNSSLASPGGLGYWEPREVPWKDESSGGPHVQRAQQESLWRLFFLDPKLWWDNRQHRMSYRSPDFRHRGSKEVLWLSNCHKPAWVDAQLAALDTEVASTSYSTLMENAGQRGDLETVSKQCEKGQLSEVVDSLCLLVHAGSRISINLFYSVLKRCVAQKDLVLGRRVHDLIVRAGYESSKFLSNHVLRMYASQGRLQEAMDVFTRVAEPDAFMWSSIISACTKHGQANRAIELYHQMRSSSVKPDDHVFVAALQACASVADLDSGQQLHSDVLETGVQPNLFVWTCLVDMYAKCGRLLDARTIFDTLVTRNVVTWNTMVSGYVQHEQGQEALSLYEQMEVESAVLPDCFTFACLLKACSGVGALQQGMKLHSQILERGLQSDIVVGTCLVDMYAKCDRLEDARRVFDSLSTMDEVTCNTMIAAYVKRGSLEDGRRLFDSLAKKDVVTWTTMIAGYAEHELGQEALALYAKMEQEGVMLANPVTYACLLKACASAAALQQGKQLHSQILNRGLEAYTVVGNALVHMYAKCGKLEDARRIFDSLPTKDVVTWNAMINGFGQSNEGHKAIDCFQEMMQDGVEADETTFTCLLVACSHEGLVKEGKQFFKAMVEERGILPTIKHYNCMVDLLGRAGYLHEAEKLLLSCESDDVGLMSLLNACKSHGDIERGARCFERLIQSDSQNAAAYILMGQIYAVAGRWSDAEVIEKLRKLAGASKKPAMAGIEVNRHVHTFVVGEERGDTSAKVRGVNTRLREEGGHVPHTQLVLKQLSEREKEDDLCGHAEKLALAYGLMNTADGTPLLVTKNLRMCGDCHSSTEIMSRIERREIIVRDAHRVHRFVDGSCRCGGRH